MVATDKIYPSVLVNNELSINVNIFLIKGNSLKSQQQIDSLIENFKLIVNLYFVTSKI
jgi:hypothetical protein